MRIQQWSHYFYYVITQTDKSSWKPNNNKLQAYNEQEKKKKTEIYLLLLSSTNQYLRNDHDCEKCDNERHLYGILWPTSDKRQPNIIIRQQFQ